MNDDLNVDKLTKLWEIQDAQIELARVAFSAGYQLGVSTFRLTAINYLKQMGLSNQQARVLLQGLDAWQAATLASEANVTEEMFRRLRGE